MPSDSKNYSDLISRRRFIEIAGVSGAAALAGCDGGGGTTDTPTEGDDPTDPDSDDTPTESDEVHDITHLSGLQAVPTEETINTHNTQVASEPARRLTQERYAAYSFADDEFILAGLEDWEFDGETATLTLRDDLQWSNGDQVTTEDVDVQFQLMEETGSAIWGFLDDTEIVDDLTYELTLSGPTYPRMVQFQLANLWFDTPASEFEQFLDEDPEEVQTYVWEDESDNVLTSGPWVYVDRNDQEWNFELNEDWRNADNINFTGFTFDGYQEAEAPQQAFSEGSDRFDSAWSMFVPPETVEVFPDLVVENRAILAKFDSGVLFNHDDEIFGDRAVRQAMAYVINRDELVQNAGPRTKFPADVPCGIAPNDIDKWLGDEKDSFETYGVEESDTDSATDVLEDADYSLTGGTWENSDGTAIEADFLTPEGWTDFTAASETIVDRLNEFGFDLTVSTQPQTDWQGSFIDGNFQLGNYNWMPGQARSSFPYFPLRHQIVNAAIDEGHSYPYEEEQTIPAMDGSGETTVTPIDVVEEIAVQPTEDDARPYVQEAAWHNNVDLPMLSLISKYEQSWLTQDEWNVDQSEPHWSVKWPTFWLHRQGQMSADP